MKKNVVKLQAVYGAGIENYMNDAPADVGPELTGDPSEPVDGKALPILGLVAFVDVYWNELLSSSIGWSYVNVDNSDDQSPAAFHSGHYALVNLLAYPTTNFMVGPEFQYSNRSNNDDGFDVNDYRIQVSLKYDFAKSFPGK